jgi:sec-independent protein translocase protein TatB
MFDIGFSELIVIGIVALVVIGPERLPKVARTAGLLLGRLQRYVGDVKADISREMQLDELKKLQSEVQESARNFERSISSEVQAIEQSVGQTVDSIKADIKDAAPSSDAVPAAGEPAGEAPSEATRQDVSLPAAKG